jgi:hypothetical protein
VGQGTLPWRARASASASPCAIGASAYLPRH